MNRRELQHTHVPLKILVQAGGREGPGTGGAHLYSEEEKKAKAWKALGLCWGLSLASIILPLAHFFLVPGFFLAGPFAFHWARRQKGLLLSLDAACPFCTAKLALAGTPGLNWPVRSVCAGCNCQVRLDPA